MLTWLCPLKPMSLVTVSAHLPGSTAIACKLMDRETDGHTENRQMDRKEIDGQKTDKDRHRHRQIAKMT